MKDESFISLSLPSISFCPAVFSGIWLKCVFRGCGAVWKKLCNSNAAYLLNPSHPYVKAPFYTFIHNTTRDPADSTAQWPSFHVAQNDQAWLPPNSYGHKNLVQCFHSGQRTSAKQPGEPSQHQGAAGTPFQCEWQRYAAEIQNEHRILIRLWRHVEQTNRKAVRKPRR